MQATTLHPEAVRFFYEHAGWSYNPRTQTSEEGHKECAEKLAASEAAMRLDNSVFIVWEYDDDIDEPGEDGGPLYLAMLCIDTDATPDIIRGYDPRDGIFERPGKIVATLGGIDLGGDNPMNYKRVVAAELYAELEEQRESAIERGSN